jgi:Flp pilus assembly protein TadG
VVRRAGRDRGSNALELAVLAPVLLLIVFFIVQAALWLYGRNVALQAAREGVSELRLVDADDDVAAAQNEIAGRVVRFAGKLGGSSLLDPAATSDYDDGAGRVTVTVTGHAVSLIPGLTLTVTRQADGEIERFEADQ